MKKILNNVKDKLKNERGDSIGEVLVALLISAVALVMLASMIASSVSLTDKSKNKLKEYYTASIDLANQQDSSSDGTGTVRIKNSTGGEISSYEVNYFLNDEFSTNPVATYKHQ